MVRLSIYFIRRLYSDYLYFASSNKSADDFHEKVTEALQLFENCMLDYSLRACVYNNTLNNAMPVRIHQGSPYRAGPLWCYCVQRGIVNRVLVQRREGGGGMGTECLNVQMTPSQLPLSSG
jgi:hypothetical protein